VGYSLVQVDDLPPEGPGGNVRFVRRHLGVDAFGINWFELPPNAEGREHNEQEDAHRSEPAAGRGHDTRLYIRRLSDSAGCSITRQESSASR